MHPLATFLHLAAADRHLKIQPGISPTITLVVKQGAIPSTA
ncbi:MULTISPECIES: hypothetical protein [Enterobacterales]